MSFTLHPRALAVLACFIPLAVAAQPTTSPELEPIVVTPSRIAQLESEVVGDVSVIDQDTLARAGQSSVAELLSRVPDIQITNNGGPQTTTGVMIRGNKQQHTLVLVDGMRINSSSQGGANWNAIDPALIERIEIIKGAASSLYGADAIGGVVNIITKKGAQDRPIALWGNFGLGTYNTVKSSFGVSGAAAGFDYSLSGSYANSDGFDTMRDTHPFKAPADADEDGYESNSVNAQLGYQITEGHRVDVNAYSAYMHGEFDGGMPDSYTNTRQSVYGIHSRNQINANWHSTLSANLSQEKIDTPVYPTHWKSLQRRYSWQNDVQLTDQQSISALVERLEERVTHSGDYTESRRNTNSAGLIYRGHFADQHHVQASVRYDKNSQFGGRTTGGLGYDLDLSPVVTVGVAANTGFRAPTFTDLYYPLDNWGFKGNPNLKAEKSRNIEAHVRYNDGQTELGATVYQNKVRDLINGYVCNELFNCTAKNIDRATIRGLTLNAAQQYEHTRIWASLDLLNPRNDQPEADASGRMLPQRAKKVLRVGADYRMANWRVGGEYLLSSHRYDDVNNTPDKRMAGYGIANLTAEYAFTKSLTAQVRWDNVFNRDYELAKGYNTPGSNVFINLQWRM